MGWGKPTSDKIVKMPKFERHIFVCGNVRPAGHPRGCCDPSGSAELQKRFKQKLAERGLKGKVRANQAGCLDQCEHGPNVVIYPEAVWYGGVTLADVDERHTQERWIRRGNHTGAVQQRQNNSWQYHSQLKIGLVLP